MLYAVLIISVLAMLYEFKYLREKRYVREIVVSSVLFTIGAILILLQIAHLELPSPLIGIQFIFQPVSQYIATILS